jgi:hypothetical protein
MPGGMMNDNANNESKNIGSVRDLPNGNPKLEAFLKKVLANEEDIKYVSPNAIPDLDLYMDQITTFMEMQLQRSRRYPDDKIMTKTMINNYTKNKLIPPPVKKKYSKEHLLLLIFVYYMKDFLSIGDIKTLLEPLTEKYFAKSDSGLSLTDIYQAVYELEFSQIGALKQDMLDLFHVAENTFPDAPEKDRGYLNQFAFICLLSFDVYMKKRIIEHMADEMAGNNQDPKAKKKK